MTEHQVSDYVAEKIREARKQRGWNADDLAARCGLTGNMIENIESGRRDREGRRRRDITVDELLVIAAALETGPLKLLPGKMAWFDLSDQKKAIEDAQASMGRDEEKLAEVEYQMSLLRKQGETLADQISKTRWLIEQLERGELSPIGARAPLVPGHVTFQRVDHDSGHRPPLLAGYLPDLVPQAVVYADVPDRRLARLRSRHCASLVFLCPRNHTGTLPSHLFLCAQNDSVRVYTETSGPPGASPPDGPTDTPSGEMA